MYFCLFYSCQIVQPDFASPFLWLLLLRKQAAQSRPHWCSMPPCSQVWRTQHQRMEHLFISGAHSSLGISKELKPPSILNHRAQAVAVISVIPTVIARHQLYIKATKRQHLTQQPLHYSTLYYFWKLSLHCWHTEWTIWYLRAKYSQLETTKKIQTSMQASTSNVNSSNSSILTSIQLVGFYGTFNSNYIISCPESLSIIS